MKPSLAFLLVLALNVIVFGRSPFQSDPPPALVFTHVNVIDMTGPPLRKDMTVVIRGERIGKDCLI